MALTDETKQSIITALDTSSLDESFIEAVLKRLDSFGYEIKEFPRILARPPIDPSEFTYGEIRNRIIAQGEDDNGIVRYATRRAFVAGLTFKQKSCHIEVGDSVDQKFIEISKKMKQSIVKFGKQINKHLSIA